MRKLCFVLLIVLGAVAKDYAQTLGVVPYITDDKSLILFINTQGGNHDTTCCRVSERARPFINDGIANKLYASKDGIVLLRDTVIAGWSRIFVEDIVIPRRLELHENGTLYLTYGENVTYVYNGYYRLLGVAVFITALILILVALVSDKELTWPNFYFSFVSFVMLFALYKVVQGGLTEMTQWDFFIIVFTLGPPALIISLIKRFMMKKK
ncbi:MAG: hypothetical protein WCG28_04350 [bacterium]